MDSLKTVKTGLSFSEQHTRRNARCSVILPLRLTTGSGEMIPAVILDVGFSGLSAIVDERASLTLPLPRGSYVDGEFFFDELEIPQLTLEVVRIKRQGNSQWILGCKFANLPAQLAAELRAKVRARLNENGSHKSR